MSSAETLRTAFMSTVFDRMSVDGGVFIIGEGSRVKTSFDYPEMLTAFPKRVITAPISEGGIVNVALGASLNGMHPIVDITFNDLLLRAMDEIVNQAGKLHYMSAGKLNPRMIIKADFNRPENAQSGNRLENYFLHQKGVNVLIPSNPRDMRYFAYHALTNDGVYLLFEDRLVRPTSTDTPCPSFGQASILQEGTDLTAISYGYTLQLLMELAKDNSKIEVIDLRTLNPLDMKTVGASVMKTKKALIVEPTSGLGVGDMISSLLPNTDVFQLKAYDVPFPAVKSLQEEIMPSLEDIRLMLEALL